MENIHSVFSEYIIHCVSSLKTQYGQNYNNILGCNTTNVKQFDGLDLIECQLRVPVSCEFMRVFWKNLLRKRPSEGVSPEKATDKDRNKTRVSFSVMESPTVVEKYS